MSIPENNPMTVEGIALGKKLYYDPILHKNQSLACATCHLQAQSFSSQPAVLPHVKSWLAA